MSRRRQAEPREPDPGPTAETLRHHATRRGDPIERLVAAGELDTAEEHAARRIREVFEGVTRCVGIHGVLMDGTRSANRRHDYAPGSRVWAEYCRTWKPWAEWMRHCGSRLPNGRKPSLAMVIDICVMGVGIDETRRTYRMRPAGVVASLRWSLRRYAEMERRDGT